MKQNIEGDSKVIFFCVLNKGIASAVLEAAKEAGVSGGTILSGRGTVKNSILEFLGLSEEKKEILIMIVKGEFEEELHEYLTDKFHLYEPNHGILFSFPLSKIMGTRNFDQDCSRDGNGGEKGMKYEVIFIVVDKGAGKEVVDVSTSAGARGATIMDARGSGIKENMFFSMKVEHEKEIVMIIIKKEHSQKVIDAIDKAMKLEEPGNGILFAVDVNKTSGLYEG